VKRLIPFFIILLFFAACTQQQAAAPPQPQQRVIAMVPNLAEAVISVGAGDMLVGRCEACNVPGMPPYAENVGGVLDPDMERVVALKPDLVLLQDTMDELKQKLEAVNLTTAALPLFTMDDVFKSIETVAGLLNKTAEGKKMTTIIKQQLQQTAAKVKNRKPVRTLLVVGHDKGSLRELYLAGPGSFLDELLQTAGGVNVFPAGDVPYPKPSKEEILRLNPDVILVLIHDSVGTPADQQRELELWRELGYLDAVKNERVHLLTDDFITVPGPRMALIAARFAPLLHPEVFAEQ